LGKIAGVKPEIRVLALTRLKSLNGKPILVGAVFRGGHWLDGIIFKRIKSKERFLEDLGRTVKRSPHYGQIRILILDGKIFGKYGDEALLKLFRRLKKPLIVFQDGKIRKLFGLEAGTAQEVIRVSMVIPPFPEALRIARLLAEAYARFLKNRNV